jgi:drug/metabolite transporter (DMT)-like permease
MTNDTPHVPARPAASADRQRWVGAGLLALSGAGFATLSILAKLAYAQGMRLLEILDLRFGGAALLLMAYLLIRRTRVYSGFRRTLPLFLLGMVGYAMQASLYVGALQRIPASVAALLLYSYPAFVALLDWLFNRRRPTRTEWLALALALVGVFLTSGRIGDVSALDRLGLAMVLASAAWYAGFILVSSRLIPSAGSLVGTAWIALGAFVTFTVLGAVMGELPSRLTAARAGIMLAMVVFSTILPIGTFMAGMVRVGPTAAALLSTLEPAFTVVLAAVYLREALSPAQIVGGGLVLAAVVLLGLPERKPKTGSGAARG